MARRIRQHVNPLALRYLEPRAVRIQAPAHLGPGTPIEVELGCADAKFCFDLAAADEERFVVGLDIREKIIEDDRDRAQRLGLRNLEFAYVNLGVDLDRVFGAGEVARFHLLFPDPWFKARHQKRRVVDLDLCAVLRRQLQPGGELHVATDIYDLALDAMAELEHPESGFENLAEPWTFWRSNPFPATSRREDTTVQRGQRVWRLRYCSAG